MNVYLIVHPVPSKLNQRIKKPAYVIAVDQGLFDAYKQDIKVDIAIGDFDSLVDKSLLEKVEHKKLNPNKDLTDTESALAYANSLNAKHIYILGGIGGSRFEHSYANLLLMHAYNNLTIITNHSTIKRYDVGSYQIKHPGYVSIFSMGDSNVSLKGFKYPLDHYEFKQSTRLGISNELTDNTGEIIVHKGKLIVITTDK